MNVFSFWDKHRKIEDEGLRCMLAETVISELQSAGWHESKLYKARYIHPQIRRKDKKSHYSLLEILADFIMMTKQGEEAGREYPVVNVEVAFYAATKRKERELSFDDVSIDAGRRELPQPRKRDQLYYDEHREWWSDVDTYNIKDIPLKPSFIGAKSCSKQWKKIINIS